MHIHIARAVSYAIRRIKQVVQFHQKQGGYAQSEKSTQLYQMIFDTRRNMKSISLHTESIVEIIRKQHHNRRKDYHKKIPAGQEFVNRKPEDVKPGIFTKNGFGNAKFRGMDKL